MLYYIAYEDYGFLRVSKGPDAGACTSNIRYAKPFTSFQEADDAARNLAKVKPYAILSTCIGS